MSTPDYYLLPDGTECRKFVQGMSYYLGTAFAYLWRAGHKPGEPMVKDLRKALDNIRFELERGEFGKGRPGNNSVYVVSRLAERSGLKGEQLRYFTIAISSLVRTDQSDNIQVLTAEYSLIKLINSLEAQ